MDDGNPYKDPPSRFATDPAYRAVATGWRSTTSVYGPVFTLASEAASLAVGTSAQAAAALYKSLAALGSVALAARAALLSRRRAFAATVVGWNPLLAIHFAGGGHNDVWMMALLLGGLVLEARGRRQSGGALCGRRDRDQVDSAPPAAHAAEDDAAALVIAVGLSAYLLEARAPL